jgi:hypothetical protein
MAKLSFAKDSTGKSIDLFIRNTSVTGSVSGLVGLTSGSVTCYYHRPGAVVAQLTLTSLASITSTHLTGGFIEVNSSTYRGFYRLDLANVMLATGVDFVTLSMSGNANMDQTNAEIELLDPVSTSGGYVWSDIRQVSGTNIGTPDTAGYMVVTVKDGTGQGELNLTSGRVQADVTHFNAVALSVTTAQVGVNVVNWSATAVTAMSSGRIIASVGEYQAGLTPLQPTTAGRTLSVNTTGQAGLDWSNISGAATVVNLAGTTIKTATDVEADTQDIQARLPAALSAGRILASVGEYQTGLVPLQPTTAGRTLDVTATGAAGIDWGNVENQTTVVDLTQTSISSVSTGASGPTSGQIATQVWATVVSGNTGVGSFGERLDRVPNVAAGANGGLPLVDASGAVKLQSGTGANQILLSSGLVTPVTSSNPTSGEIATQVWATVIEGSFTAIASMKLQNAAMAGKASGLQNLAPVYRDLSDTLDRISASSTVSGNRTAISYSGL